MAFSLARHEPGAAVGQTNGSAEAVPGEEAPCKATDYAGPLTPEDVAQRHAALKAIERGAFHVA